MLRSVRRQTAEAQVVKGGEQRAFRVALGETR